MKAKICGIKTLEAAKQAVEHSADFIGIILVPNRVRTVGIAVAKEISSYIHSLPEPRPQLVGVFRNQALEEVLALQEQIPLDIIQLHGNEALEWLEDLPSSVIKRIVPQSPTFVSDILYINKLSDKKPSQQFWALVDSEQGGHGEIVDWSSLSRVAEAGGSYILAGGLSPVNVKLALSQPGCIGVDVSGGVETNGEKDMQKISNFLAIAKGQEL